MNCFECVHQVLIKFIRIRNYILQFAFLVQNNFTSRLNFLYRSILYEVSFNLITSNYRYNTPNLIVKYFFIKERNNNFTKRAKI